jgi:hypothetical protein
MCGEPDPFVGRFRLPGSEPLGSGARFAAGAPSTHPGVARYPVERAVTPAPATWLRDVIPQQDQLAAARRPTWLERHGAGGTPLAIPTPQTHS